MVLSYLHLNYVTIGTHPYVQSCNRRTTNVPYDMI